MHHPLVGRDATTDRHPARLARRAGLAALAGLALLPAALAGPAAGATTTTAPSPKLAALIAAAKKEGQLNVIALPPDWANYGQIISAFSKKYDIKVNSANPNGSSADELTAAKSLKGQSRAPDVFDVAPQFAEQGRQEGLFAPYKVSTWSTIPGSLKNAQGYWTGDYWGVIAFGVNTDVVKDVPKSWSDLTKPEFSGKVALNGDPRKAGAAFGGVFASALGNGGSLTDIEPGISYFAGLKSSGNFIPVESTPATVATGQTPVTIDWSYLQRGYADQFKGKLNWQVSVPSGPVFANFYAQAINKTAPHPNAARLWEEFLYSDQGQNLWMKGYAYAARFKDLNRRKAIPAATLKNLPPASVAEQAQFPTLAQINAAKNVVESQWGTKVAGA